MCSRAIRNRASPVPHGLPRQGGLTLVELVLVIVLLGVLAAQALPHFVQLAGDAEAAAIQGVAGAITTAAGINYLARKANPAAGVGVTDCSHAATLLTGGLPAGYSMGPQGFPLPIVAESSASCTVYGPGGTTAQTTLLGIL